MKILQSELNHQLLQGGCLVDCKKKNGQKLKTPQRAHLNISCCGINVLERANIASNSS